MRKYLNWELPFSDIHKNRYLVEIFANTQPTDGVKTLLGENVALDSSEKKPESLLGDVITKTTCLHIINNEGRLDFIDELMPRDNTKRFVRVWRLDRNGQKLEITMQGFFSSDSFSQDYVSRPNAVDVNINMMLAAMKDIEAKQNVPDQNGTLVEGCLPGKVSIKELIDYAIGCASRKTGVKGAIDGYYTPRGDRYILDKEINTYDIFETETLTFDNNERTMMKGLSLQEILRRICDYMGWVARENGNEIFFQDVYDPTLTYEHYKLQSNGEYQWVENEPIRSDNMATFDYTGTEHQKTIVRGAKYVEVVAKMNEREPVELPECPYSMLREGLEGNIWYVTNEGKDSSSSIMQYVVSKDNRFYQNIKTSYIKATLTAIGNNYSLDGETPSNENEMESHFPCIPQMQLFDQAYQATVYSGALFARLEMSYDPAGFIYKKMQTGLYCTLLPGSTQNNMAVFSMTSERSYRFDSGYLHINADAIMGGIQRYNSANLRFFSEGVSADMTKSRSLNFSIQLGLRVGNKYWNGYGWLPTMQFGEQSLIYSSFSADFDGKNFKTDPQYTQGTHRMEVNVKNGIVIPITEPIEGQIEIAIFPKFAQDPNHINIPCSIFFSKLSVDFLPPYNHLLSDKNENHYLALTGFSFDETISKSLDMATFNGNTESPSYLLEPSGSPMTELEYDLGGGVSVRLKPEQRLLENMRKYYSAPRAEITLKTDIQQTPTPLARVIGYDGKVYYPMSEQIDYFMQENTLTLLEVGDYEEDIDPDNEDVPE